MTALCLCLFYQMTVWWTYFSEELLIANFLLTESAVITGKYLTYAYSVSTWHRIVIFNVVFLVIAFMIVKHSFRLFIVWLIHDLVLNLLNSLNFCRFSKFPFVVLLLTKWLTKPIIRTGPIRKLTDWHVTRPSQWEHAISPEVACAI